MSKLPSPTPAATHQAATQVIVYLPAPPETRPLKSTLFSLCFSQPSYLPNASSTQSFSWRKRLVGPL